MYIYVCVSVNVLYIYMYICISAENDIIRAQKIQYLLGRVNLLLYLDNSQASVGRSIKQPNLVTVGFLFKI